MNAVGTKHASPDEGNTEIRRRYLLAAASIAAYAALRIGIPHIPLPRGSVQTIGLVALSVMVFMGVQMALVRWVASVQPKPWAAATAMICFGAGFAALLKTRAKVPAATELLLILFLCMLGYLVSLALRERNLLLPVALFSPVFDITTVFWGPAKAMVEKAPRLVEAVSAGVPAPGALRPISMVGPGDFAFLTIFFAAIYRFRMNDRRTYWIMLPLVTLTMFAVLLLRGVPALPGLVPMGIAVIAANWRLFKLTTEEKWALAAAAAVVVGVAVFAALR